MSDNPNEPGEGQNPFRGTPFEQIFAAFTSGEAGTGAGMPGMPDLSALMSQMQAMMQPYEGPVNWPAVQDIARKHVAQQADPSPSDKMSAAVADAVQLADHWLDGTTPFPSGVTSTAAWSRAEWVVNTSDIWKVLVEPVAAQAVGSMGKMLPEEAQAMAGQILGMLGKATGAMLAGQIGSALGGLASEVLTASDIGLPLGPQGRAAVVPANVATFTEGLDGVSRDDVLLYVALREAAHQRLFAHVPWLRDHLIEAVAAYAAGTEVDPGAIQQAMQDQLGSFDPTNPDSMAKIQEALSSGLFEPKKSPRQQAALDRLEVTLALVEGWVDEVVDQATTERMPTAPKLREAFRRRRAAGGPAEDTFASLVGLELRPRRLRDASTLWGSLRSRQGIEARDGVWMHPDLLPTAADLDDPLGFRESASDPGELSDAQFDEELQRLLDGGMGGASGPDVPPEAGPTS